MKNALKNFVHQLDAINTISGGTVATSVDIKKSDRQIDILINAPSISSHAFNVFVKGSQLIVYATLREERDALMNEEGSVASRHMVPLFNQVFDIPQNVTADNIEAIFEHGRLRLILPLDESSDMPVKRIYIRES